MRGPLIDLSAIDGYKECPHCNGYGSSLKEEADQCTHCQGWGLIKIRRPIK